MIEKFKEAFREEATELLTNLESTVLELERSPTDEETISSVFRTMHTIKGSSAMFGFEEIARFTHEIESIMDLLREGAFIADRAFIDLTLSSRDMINAMLAGSSPELRNESNALVEEFKAHAQSLRDKKMEETRATAEAGDFLEAQPEQTSGVAAPLAMAADQSTFRIRFTPCHDVFLNGTKPLLLLEELRSLGTASVRPISSGVPPLSELDPEKSYFGWDISLSTDRGEDAVRDVFIFVSEDCGLEITRIDAKESEPKLLGEILIEEKIATQEQIQNALEEQERGKKTKEFRQMDSTAASIRVASDKLDGLVDLVGELVTLQARLSRTAGELKDGGLTNIAEQFERLMSQLRGNTMSIRMLPIGSTFSKFRRVVRDLSAEMGKEIELVTAGADTELDKTVIERLNDPLVHIIRNSIDHGIEAPEAREAAGKARAGTITLSAMHSGAHVLIEISDDGAGINTDRVFAKAVERGIVGAGTELSKQELFQLIFAPGFSTAQTVTSVSGRGVGMDVVKREIDSLGGSVSVDSTRGSGTNITLRIPLTLAIIEGLLVRIGNEHFVIPLSSVDGCLEIKREDRCSSNEGRRLLSYRSEVLPYVGVRELFDVPGEAPPIEQIVVVNAHESRVGFVVDEVVGDYQTVIKPLGRMFKNAVGVSGATILGDGTVALIIDVNRLAMNAQQAETRRIKAERGERGDA